MLKSLGVIDEFLYRQEKRVVAAMLLTMGVMVFFDVMHRVSTREGSFLANPAIMVAIASVVATLAFVTRGTSQAIGKGIATGIAIIAGQQVFIRVMPNGLVWSQTLAMAFTLWLGMIGACLAAHDRRHLALDVGSKLWPASIAHRVAAVGHFITALFSFGILFLSIRSVGEHYHTWASTEGAAGTLTGLPVPKFAVFAAIPIGMAILGFRFTLEGIKVWLGLQEVGGDDTLRQLGIEDVAAEAAATAAPASSGASK